MTARVGWLTTVQLMASLSLDECMNQHFPPARSNRGYTPAEIINTLILMQHAGSFHLDDVRHLQADEALRTVMGLDKLPQATTLGGRLRRLGKPPQTAAACVAVNRRL